MAGPFRIVGTTTAAKKAIVEATGIPKTMTPARAIEIGVELIKQAGQAEKVEELYAHLAKEGKL